MSTRAAWLPIVVPFVSRLVIVGLIVSGTAVGRGEEPNPSVAPRIAELDPSLPLMRGVIDRFTTDLKSMERSEGRTSSPYQRARRSEFCQTWLSLLVDVPFDTLNQEGRIDYLLFKTRLQRELRSLKFEQSREGEVDRIVAFGDAIWKLHEARQANEPVNSQHAANTLSALTRQIPAEMQLLKSNEHLEVTAATGRRAVARLEGLARTLRNWHAFYNEYDPIFTWWTAAPFEVVIREIETYREYIESRFVGRDKDKDKIVGESIGTEALLADLASEMIPYSPEELVAIANQEFAWCEAEYRKAAQELGFGNDWRKGLEHVKSLHVEPGKQPEVIRQLAEEAVQFLDERHLVSIPEQCRRVWRMEMMSPERQKVNPYFTGGEVISVSFPTRQMEHDDKLMSLRANNIHFARATVHHELIPGHHLQLYMADRYRMHRELFRTPFLVEGWALYWEMLLWDLGLHQGPEDRIGMLFWRSHRCARIIFSLSYHMGTMTEDQAVEFLVERVGHERRSAEAEVRRSVQGEYEPLYQAAYMLGGLQIRALRKELVDSGKMTELQFHDAILWENSIPVEMIRASLLRQPLSQDFQSSWRFYD